MSGITKAEQLRRADLARNGIKVCARCKREMSFEMFPLDKSTSDGMARYCIECKTEYRKNRYNEHIEEEKERQRQYYKDNTECCKQYQKKNYYAKRDKKLENARVYRNKHSYRIRLAHKIWYANNKDKVKAYFHTERVILMRRIYANNRRIMEMNAEGTYSKEDVRNALSFFDNKCAYTGAPLEERYHLDHIVALKNGGTNYIWNIVPSNHSPNESKGTKDMELWFRQQEYFSEERLRKIYEWINLKKQELEGAIK